MFAIHTTASSAPEDGSIAPNAVKWFLAGGEPRAGTRRKLEAWYGRWVRTRADQGSGEVVWMALQLLLGNLPPASRAASLAELLATLERVLSQARVDPPAWLREVRERLVP